MPKTKISEFSATPGNNTDIDGINIAEGCAPSGINDAIRELMAQLKDFQAGTAGDSFNGPVGSTTAAAGAFTTLSASSTVSGAGFSTYLASPPAIGGTAAAAGSFTTLSASSTVSGTGFSTYLASPPAIGGTAAAAGSFTTLTTSSTVTHNGGTANGVAYLNGSKVLTTGSALVFNGTQFGINGAPTQALDVTADAAAIAAFRSSGASSNDKRLLITSGGDNIRLDSANQSGGAASMAFSIGSTEGMRLTSTGLGIGTSSPKEKLDSRGAAVFSGDNATGTNAFGTSAGILLSTASDGSQARITAVSNGNNNVGLIFRALNAGSAASSTLLLDSSGNLGLNVTPSAWESNSKAMQFGGGAIWSYLTSQINLLQNAYYNSSGNLIYTNTAAASAYRQISGVHSWYTAASGTAGNTISFTQAMTLDASGNLGIGTTSPTTKLSITDSTGPIVRLVRTSNRFEVAADNDYMELNARDASTYIRFKTADTERARITSGGDFGIGTSSPGQKLDVAGNITSSAWTGRANGSAPSADCAIYRAADNTLGFSTASTERARIDSSGILLVGRSSANVGTNGVRIDPDGNMFCSIATGNESLNVYSTSASAYRHYVNAAGTIFATNTTISAISDIRFKENVRDLDAGLADILALKPRKFDWKEGKGKDIKDDRGFIAQEFEQVFPDLIDEWKDPAPEGEAPYKSVRQDLIPVLVKAIQEQQAIITTLTARVAALEAK